MIKKNYNNNQQKLSPLADKVVTLLYNTINTIKQNDNEKTIYNILATSITLLTNVLKPYLDKTIIENHEIDTTYKN